MGIVHFVTAATEVDVMDILRLMISCLTGIGAFALGTTVIVVLYVVRVIRRLEKQPQVDWEKVLQEVQDAPDIDEDMQMRAW